MIDFMTALRLILFQHQRAKGVQFQLTCNLCRDSHKTQVWLCFLILSFLSTCHSAPSANEIKDLKTFVEWLESRIENSDAMLYTPPTDRDTCTDQTLGCYLLEMMVIIEEENIKDPKTPTIYHFNKTLSPEAGCPPCEIHPLKNSKMFFKSLRNILEKLAMHRS